MQTFRRLTSLLLTLLAFTTQAQVVTTQPSPFLETDAVTIIFDATKGDAGLKDFTGDVFIYTGVVTASPTSGTWNHVKSPSFNTGDPASKMTRLSPNLYSITITPRTFYPGVLATEKIYRLAMLFKNADGTKAGRGTSGSDIYIDVAQDAFDLRFTNPTGTPPFFFAQNTATNVGYAAVHFAILVAKDAVTQQLLQQGVSLHFGVATFGAQQHQQTRADATDDRVTDRDLRRRDPLQQRNHARAVQVEVEVEFDVVVDIVKPAVRPAIT